MPSTLFEPLCSALDGVDTRVLPLPGYEGPLEDLALWQDPDALESDLLRRLPAGPVVLLGWSLGGTIALMLAKRAPERVVGVVLLASNPCFVARDQWPGMDAVVFEQFVKGAESDMALTLRRFQQLCCQGSPEVRSRARWLREQGRFNGDERALLPSLSLLARDHRPLLASLSQPHLSLLARDDALVPVSLSDSLPGERVCIDGSSHLLLVDQPEAVAQQVKGFLQRINAAYPGAPHVSG